MYLYLVRHGQSQGNVLKTFHGQTDYPLTELGLRQAREAAEKLRQMTFSRCCASDLARARDTAQACLEGRNVTMELCPALREQFVGEMEELTWEEMEERFPKVLHPYIEDWFHTIPPSGESPDDMAARVAACVDEIVRAGEDTLLVAHNGSLSLVLKHLGLAGEKELFKPDWWFQQGTVTTIQVDENGARLVAFNQ